MPTNPLEDDPERERLIKERAYHLWDSEGRPPHRDAEFWERARELVGMQSSADFGQLPNPIAAGADPNQVGPIEEASIQENLGEFPDRLADQGEVAPTPMAKHSKAEAATPPGKAKNDAKEATGKAPKKPSKKLTDKPKSKA